MRSSAKRSDAANQHSSSDLYEPWCTVPLSENRWPITNDNSSDVVATLDYEYPLASGKLLSEVPELLAGAKETTRLMRNEGRSMSADQQVLIHRDVLAIMHALNSRRISSLAEVQYQDVIDVVSRMRHGIDGLLQIELRIDAFFALKLHLDDLPESCIVPVRRRKPQLNRREVLRRCSLPESVINLPCTARALRRGEKKLKIRSLRKLLSGKDPKVVTQPTIDRYASILRAMFRLRRDMRCDALLFDPLEGEDVGALLRTGKALEKTPIPPDALAFALLETCTGLIVERGDAIVARHFELSTAFLTNYDHELALANRKDVRSLGVACFVVIACFTGRRLSEILKISRDCLAGNDGYGWWLRTLILKKGELEFAWLPIPIMVARVVHLLLRLGEHLTDASENDILFQYYDPIFDKRVRLNAHSFLNEFASERGLNIHIDERGEERKWHWQSRQFRRFFALIYFYRYGGSLEAVSAALRHHDLETTRGYLCLDGNLDAYFRAEEYRFKRKIMEDIANDNEDYSGTAAKRLKKYSQKLHKLFSENITIMTVDEADLMIRFASKNMMVFRVKRWVTCCCPESADAVFTARCHEFPTDKTQGPAIENGGPSVCGKGCIHAMFNAANRNYIHERLTKRADCISKPPRNLFEQFERMNLLSMQRIVNANVKG